MKKILNKLFNKNLNIYLLLFLMIRLLFLFYFGDRVPQTKDYELRYKILAENIIKGEEYGKGADIEYPPLYPALVALNFIFFGSQTISIKVMQIVFDLIICALLCSIGTMLVNKKIGILAMTLWGIYPLAIWQTNVLGTESLFTLLLILFMTLFIMSYKKSSPSLALFSGLSLGMAMITRPMMNYFPIFIFFIFLIRIPRKKIAILFFSLFILGFFTANIPLILMNYNNSGKIEMGAKFRDGQGFGRLIFDGSDKDYVFADGKNRYKISDSKRDSLFALYEKSGLTKKEILINTALKKIVSDPLLYGKLVCYKIWKLFTFTISGTYDDYIKMINIPIILLSLIGLVSIHQKINNFLPIISIILYFIVIYSLLVAMLRYLMPVIPFIILLSAIGLNNVYSNMVKIYLNSRQNSFKVGRM